MDGKMATCIGEISFCRRNKDMRDKAVRKVLKQYNLKVLSSQQNYIELDFYRMRLAVGQNIAESSN